MAGRHHRLDGHESEQTKGVGDGQGGLVSNLPLFPAPRGLSAEKGEERLCPDFIVPQRKCPTEKQSRVPGCAKRG